MLENLTKKFSSIIKGIRGETKITEENSAEILAEIRYALLEADVALPVVKNFIANIRDRSLGKEVIHSLTPGQSIVQIVNQELITLLSTGNDEKPFLQYQSSSEPQIILMAGLQGVGKTTTTGKIGLWISKKRKARVLLASCDTYRPAAAEQLKILADSVNIDFFEHEKTISQPVQIGETALNYAKKFLYDYLLIDTAGRLSLDEAMMAELQQLQTTLEPSETLFVVDSMQGQNALSVAVEFNNRVKLSGVVLTKVDGDSRGGTLLSVRSVTGCPIRFVGNSEKLDGLELFDATRFADRILGMGDILSLVEKAQESIETEDSEKLALKLKSGKKFNLNDYRKQISQVNKLGGIASILNYLPSAIRDKAQNLNTTNLEKNVKKQDAIISSMTKRERIAPEIIKAQRKKRIALGSGNTIPEVNQLLNQFNTMQSLLKQGGGISKNIMSGVPNFKSANALDRRKNRKQKKTA
ncbi:signal recognition particle protein [Betaproteobacteria bacterium]|nr:signal recognition particle protein [Betaproteobacteria bacterium]